MAYAAEDAEIALLALLDTQTGPHMASLVREFLRTRHIHSDISAGTEPVSDARMIASHLLRHKKFPQLNEPSEIDLAQALQAYIAAPAPTPDELENRYQRLMARVKSPNKLYDLRYDGPSDAEGYRRLASGLTRELKLPTDAPYTHDELQAIALVCEHYTNLRRHQNPWSPVAVSQRDPIPTMVHRSEGESDISFAERSYYEAANRISRIYTGSILRDPATDERKARVKDIYHPECRLFELAPSLSMGTDYEQFARHLFTGHKMHTADASARVGKLAEALSTYHHAFETLITAQEHQLKASPDAQAYASFVATNAFRRELLSMKSLLIREGFSHEAASSALFTFAVRYSLGRNMGEELDAALAKAAKTHGEAVHTLDANTRREWLADVTELQPYVSARALFHPAQGVEASSTLPGNTVSPDTIQHLATVGLAVPNLGYHMD